MNKKLLVFDIGFLIGNNRTPIISKITYWQGKGLNVDIFCTHEAKEIYAENLKNIKYIVLPKANSPKNRILLIFEYLKRNLIAIFYLKKIINKKYHGVYSISAVLDLVIFPYILKLLNPNLKWFVVFDNTVERNEPGNKFIKLLAYLFYRLSLLFIRNADIVFVVTGLLKKSLLSEGFSKEQLIVTGNGIEIEIMDSVKVKKKEYDGLFIGRVNETKGVYDLLDVLKIVTKTIPKFKLAIMGRGDDDSERAFIYTIQRMGLSKNVKLIGFKSGHDKFKVIKESKMFIFLSQSESFGVALLEAVVSGIPAVVYNLEPYRDIYKNNEVVAVKKGDTTAVARNVIKILKSKKTVNTNGMMLHDKYGWHNISEIEYKQFCK